MNYGNKEALETSKRYYYLCLRMNEILYYEPMNLKCLKPTCWFGMHLLYFAREKVSEQKSLDIVISQKFVKSTITQMKKNLLMLAARLFISRRTILNIEPIKMADNERGNCTLPALSLVKRIYLIANMSETPTPPAVVTVMTHEEEAEEVRTLLLRHQERIVLDLGNTDLLTVLVKNSVLSQSEEDLLLKPYTAIAPPPSPVLPQTISAPSSVNVIKRKLCAVISNASNSSNSSSNNNLGTTQLTNNGSGGSGSAGNNSPSVSVIDDPVQVDNCSLATTSENNAGVNPLSSTGDTNSDHYSTKEELRSLMLNDAEILRLQCSNLIEIIAKSGFEKFKQFCYAIENECPQLIEDLINDRLKCVIAVKNTKSSEHSYSDRSDDKLLLLPRV
uniref:CARD domain-containing protein n=1 Tax=Glossina brevipalpis TaxID=37001 RepID=A0A1A9WH11_9MUSC